MIKSDPVYLLDALSNKNVTFFIPPYQRNYEWTEDICAVFFEDVRRVAEANRAGQEAEHFFGSIVYVVEQTGLGMPDKYVLTDGQQRITSTMLLLMALRDSIDDQRYKDVIQEDYLQNAKAGEETEYKIKLKQVETDWEAYRNLALGQDVPSALKDSAVFKNYQYFREAVKGLPIEERQSLLEDGLTRFKTISIRLDPDKNPWQNPQEIFESMNPLGKPLSLADLVRNYLLMGKTAKEQTDLYRNYWLPLEKRLPGQLSDFIRDWVQADQHRSYKVARESNYKELYREFKDIVRDRDAEALLADFVRFAGPYAAAIGLAETGVSELDKALSDLGVIEVKTLSSYLAEILALRGDWEPLRLRLRSSGGDPKDVSAKAPNPQAHPRQK